VSIQRFDLVAVLEGTALFSGLSAEELRALAARTVRKRFKTGELLFSEGEPCHGLHVIATGKVRIFKASVNGREQVLAVNQAGESVAELPSSMEEFTPPPLSPSRKRRSPSSRSAIFTAIVSNIPRSRSRCSP